MPVLPATVTPGKNAPPLPSWNARQLVPSLTVCSIIVASCPAVSLLTTRRVTGPSGADQATASPTTTLSTTLGLTASPSRATMALSSAASSGESVEFQKPAAVRANSSGSLGTWRALGCTGTSNVKGCP